MSLSLLQIQHNRRWNFITMNVFNIVLETFLLTWFYMQECLNINVQLQKKTLTTDYAINNMILGILNVWQKKPLVWWVTIRFLNSFNLANYSMARHNRKQTSLNQDKADLQKKICSKNMCVVYRMKCAMLCTFQAYRKYQGLGREVLRIFYWMSKTYMQRK